MPQIATEQAFLAAFVKSIKECMRVYGLQYSCAFRILARVEEVVKFVNPCGLDRCVGPTLWPALIERSLCHPFHGIEKIFEHIVCTWLQVLGAPIRQRLGGYVNEKVGISSRP